MKETYLRTKDEISKSEADADFTLPEKDDDAEIINDDSPAREPSKLVSSPQQITQKISEEIWNSGWWDHVWSTYDNITFKRNFRVSRAKFLYITDHIREDIEKNTLTEIHWSPELRLGICLYVLGKGDYCYDMKHRKSFIYCTSL